MSERAETLCLWALVCHVLAIFLFIPHPMSVTLTYIMVKRKYVKKGRKTILILSLIEMICWFLCVVTSWIVFRPYFYYYDYDYAWWYGGWAFVVVWWVVCIVLGSIRMIIASEYRGRGLCCSRNGYTLI
jgi:hypothetical protein